MAWLCGSRQKFRFTPPSGSEEIKYRSLRIIVASRSFFRSPALYAPTMTNDEEVQERFYQDLDKFLLSIPAEDKLIIMGDFNARVGQNGGVWKGIIGKHRVRKKNSNGILLLSKCVKHDLAITNTFFRLPAKKRTTWMHPRSKQWHLMDYIITKQRDLNSFITKRFL